MMVNLQKSLKKCKKHTVDEILFEDNHEQTISRMQKSVPQAAMYFATMFIRQNWGERRRGGGS